MITSDSISVVGNYYKKQLGDPMVENEGAAVMFQITGTPTTFITINHDEEDRDKTRITVIQSPIKLPRMN